MLRIGILTSSRADYGIYLPIIKKFNLDSFFKCSLIVFGTHLSKNHGFTCDQILKNGFKLDYTLNTVPDGDSPSDISESIGDTVKEFSHFWKKNKSNFDLIFCLGDRYEMFSAVIAGVPLQVPFAHLHGGETTLGAIDNVFRHSITLSSKFHFVATNDAYERVFELTQSENHIYNVGALSLDNLDNISTLSKEEFYHKWNVNFTNKTILTTFHPETISHNENANFAQQIVDAIDRLEQYQVLITMPNADTNGSLIREIFIKHFATSKRVFLIENLGSQGYFSAMKYSCFLLGNTSSGIIEAASFGKYVINLGDRQKGRTSGNNVIHVPILTQKILDAVDFIEKSVDINIENCYYNGGAADKIIEVLKKNYT